MESRKESLLAPGLLHRCHLETLQSILVSRTKQSSLAFSKNNWPEQQISWARRREQPLCRISWWTERPLLIRLKEKVPPVFQEVLCDAAV